ncbi:4,4'-diaponeurosporenoate glycosyltransferase [Alkalibacterium sp. AK22]|uniref:glycosyltransferase family 2 protein n=1 Tax=Alkalibacterium sp. AK22 TaxID=1229520 RepID=UPI00044EA942|nr:glycosyltransferase family 2 protein [Alkalibacterium sp. AK22]EXJ23196.1 4,4'-diaponeurosporenoate glycosyltransferase [Alkalibacterium sp. AK22]
MIEWLNAFFLIFGFLGGVFFLWKIPLIPCSKKERTDIRVSLIIPARNEELSLPGLLGSIQEQSFTPHEVIVVDDDSTDQTASIAAAYGASVISGKDKTAAVKGKSQACWKGFRKSEGEWLLFLDADTRFTDRDSLKRILGCYSEMKGQGILSIQPYHIIQKVYETLSIVPNIMVMAGLNRFSLMGRHLPEKGAFGPLMLTNREQYQHSGGHGAIINSHMDDIELAKLYQQHSWPVAVYGGAGVFSFRMYPGGLRQLIDGWTKSLVHGSKETHGLVSISIAFWVAGVFSSLGQLILASFTGNTIGLLLLLAVYLLYSLEFRWLMNKVGAFPRWTAFFSAFFVLSFVLLFFWAWIQVKILKRVRWRDRVIKT